MPIADRARTPRTLLIADHLWEAFAAMADEMGADREALVNQALYTFARLNGFVLPLDLRRASAVAQERTPRPAPPLAVAPPPLEERPGRRPIAPAERTPEPPRLAMDGSREDEGHTAVELPSLSQLGLSPRIISSGAGRAENSDPTSSSQKRLVLVADGKELERPVKERFLIGRGKHCDLIINSGKVSREHAAIVRDGASWYIEDLGSSNGTWYDKRRITRRQIQDGDEYYICSEKLACVFR